MLRLTYKVESSSKKGQTTLQMINMEADKIYKKKERKINENFHSEGDKHKVKNVFFFFV